MTITIGKNNNHEVFLVSMGGSTALFLGASILSFVEIVYYFFVRPVSNSVLAKKTKKEKRKFKLKVNKMEQLILPTVS